MMRSAMPTAMRRLFGLLVVAVLAVPRSAPAQDGVAPAADSLFQSAKAAMDRGEYDIACDRFQESFRLQAAVGTLLNMGACEEHRGHAAIALQCFRDALTMLGAGDYRRSYAEEHLAKLKNQVAYVRLTIEGEKPSDMQVSLDGLAVGGASVGLEFSLDAGSHSFIVTAHGFDAARADVRVVAGEHRDVSLRIRRSAAAPAASDVGLSSPERRKESRAAPYALLAGGGAALVAGAVFGVVVWREATVVHDHCSDSQCDEEGVAAAHRGKPYAVLSPAFLAAGAALAGAGTIWLTLSRSATVSAAVRPSAGAIDASMAVHF